MVIVLPVLQIWFNINFFKSHCISLYYILYLRMMINIVGSAECIIANFDQISVNDSCKCHSTYCISKILCMRLVCRYIELSCIQKHRYRKLTPHKHLELGAMIITERQQVSSPSSTIPRLQEEVGLARTVKGNGREVTCQSGNHKIKW